MIDLTTEGISIVAGPVELKQPCSSFELLDIAGYPPGEVVAVLETIPGFVIENHGEPDWWSWRARFRNNEDVIDTITMSLFDGLEHEPLCSIDFLRGACRPQTLIDILNTLKEDGFPCLWFHNVDSEMFTPESFAARYG